MKVEQVRTGVYIVIALAVKHHGHAVSAQVTIMQHLQYYEHLSEPMADCLWMLASRYDNTQLCDDMLREIAGKSFNAQDTKGPRHFSRFLVRLAELLPRPMLKQLSLLLNHLDSEVSHTAAMFICSELTVLCQAYPMRIAIVEVIGQLIREVALSPNEIDGQQATKQLSGLYDLLIERAMDVSSYVRTRVLAALAKLCDLPVKFPKQRLSVTKVAVDSLEDKTATVRKSAVVLLMKLILTHPYGLMHGGLLSLQEWEQRYQTAASQLKSLEDVVGKGLERNTDGEEGEDGEGNEKEVKEEENDGEAEEEEEENDEDERAEGEPEPSKKRSKGKQRYATISLFPSCQSLLHVTHNQRRRGI